MRRYAKPNGSSRSRSRPRGRSTAACCRRESSRTSPRPRRSHGELARADATAQRGLRISQASAEGWEPFLWGVRAQIALARGDLPTARRYIERTFAGVDLGESTMPYREFHDVARHVYFRLGDPATAFRHFAAFKRLDDEGRNMPPRPAPR